MADEEIAVDADAASGGGLMTKLLVAGVGLLLLGTGVIGGMVFFGDAPSPDETETADSIEEKSGPALYTSLHPPLVVNFRDSLGDPHFMQVTMEVMARDQDVINAVREHTPAIRNSLILLYGGIVYEEISTREGKEKMLADGLAEIRKVIKAEIGKPGVEAVYFTSLVVQ